jgi:C4-dicarboxylate-binding protein DctP
MGILFSCGGGSTSQGSSSGTDPITIKISHPVSDTDPTHLGFIDFKNHIEDTSKGRFKVELYPNKQLANSDVENLELLVRKSIEITFTASSGLATQGNIRDYFIYDYPYFFQSDEIVLLFS